LRNSTAVILTIVGGVFYLIGGIVVVAISNLFSSSFGNLGNFGIPTSLLNMTTYPSTSGAGFSGLAELVGGFGILSGILIIFGGFLLQMPQPNRRKAGGILAAVMLLLGSVATLGGLVIGFILGAIGCYLGLTYKSTRSNLTVGLGPVGSLTLGPQSAPPGGAQVAGHGPLQYCIKCGSKLREGAVFCGACGARVSE
jgi:hypothetical protein